MLGHITPPISPRVDPYYFTIPSQLILQFFLSFEFTHLFKQSLFLKDSPFIFGCFAGHHYQGSSTADICSLNCPKTTTLSAIWPFPVALYYLHQPVSLLHSTTWCVHYEHHAEVLFKPQLLISSLEDRFKAHTPRQLSSFRNHSCLLSLWTTFEEDFAELRKTT